ncbi:hypothetical protein ASF79_00240 [Agreia sp. Leaf335]|uniref:hypothetical protein n=1 Tax=Agreia sp. Leaf335 TaxID=1736340 RepID=UPI0006F219FC|nr:MULTISPECIES: hypothetical protein [Microbacteriaceae]KQR23737.1 hypothetical protein ASF79_00240 [Agreia sp. Leaf335]PPF62469.1 hypothetical protein C5E11_11225 [Clavibacter michiganensis]
MIHETNASASSIDDVVRAVPGVTSVYPQLPEILGLPTPVADLARGVAAQLVEPTVRIRIGIADADASRAVCERVHAAVLQHLLQQAPEGTPASALPVIAVSVVAIG